MKKVTSILALLLVSNSYALELEGINGVEIMAINGKEVKSSFFSKNDNEIEPGQHQIVVRYRTQFNNDEIIESRPSIFTLDLQKDTQISVNRMNSQRLAEKAMKAGLTWQIVNEDKQYEIDNSDMLSGDGFMPYSDIEKLIVNYNQDNNIKLAGTAVTATAVTTTAAVSTQSTATTEGGNSLITLYEQSSKEQQKAFRLWLLEQDMK